VEDRWHELSGFRSEKSRNIDIRIRDPAKSEIPMSDGTLNSQLARASEFRRIGHRESENRVA
jgi:hypothetical protein